MEAEVSQPFFDNRELHVEMTDALGGGRLSCLSTPAVTFLWGSQSSRFMGSLLIRVEKCFVVQQHCVAREKE